MNGFPPNINPNLFSLTASIAGSLIINDFNGYELAAIGNWIVLLGQYIVTASAQKQLLESRNENFFNCENLRNDLDNIINAINIIQNELEKLKKDEC